MHFILGLLVATWCEMPTYSKEQCNVINTLRPRQDGRHFPDDIFKCIFLNENEWISLKISLKFVCKGPINNIPASVQIMAWRRPGDKLLSEPMMFCLPTHICVTRPHWVNDTNYKTINTDNTKHWAINSINHNNVNTGKLTTSAPLALAPGKELNGKHKVSNVEKYFLGRSSALKYSMFLFPNERKSVLLVYRTRGIHERATLKFHATFKKSIVIKVLGRKTRKYHWLILKIRSTHSLQEQWYYQW